MLTVVSNTLRKEYLQQDSECKLIGLSYIYQDQRKIHCGYWDPGGWALILSVVHHNFCQGTHMQVIECSNKATWI